jgi:hypothetical protein
MNSKSNAHLRTNVAWVLAQKSEGSLSEKKSVYLCPPLTKENDLVAQLVRASHF